MKPGNRPTSVTPLKLFTQPAILRQIGHRRLIRLFEPFAADLQATQLQWPTPDTSTYDAPNEKYFAEVSAVLSRPDQIPPTLYKALATLESAASPENDKPVWAAIYRCLPGVSVNQDCALDRVLDLWFVAPSELAQFAPVLPARADVPPPPPVPSPVRAPASSLPGPLSETPSGPPTSSPMVACSPAPQEEVASAQEKVPSATVEPAMPAAPCQPASPNEAKPASVAPVASGQPCCHHFHRHRGKVARLPHKVREKVNFMIYDGVPYCMIIKSLGKLCQGLKPYHLSRWRKTGYQDWLRKQERKDLSRAKERFALEILREQDGSKVHAASLQIAASQLCQFLADFDPATLLEKLQADPQNFVRLLSVLPKLTASGILCESHRADMVDRDQRGKKASKPPGLSPEARAYIEEHRFNPPPH